MIIVAIGAWLGRLLLVCKHIEVCVYHLFQWHRQQFLVHRYLATRVLRLRRVHNQFGMLLFAVHDVDALNGAPHRNRAVVGVYVSPLQAANLADAQPRSQTDVYAKIAEREVLPNEVQNLLVVRHRQHLNLLAALRRRILYVPLAIVHALVLHAELHHHFQHDKDVLHGLHAQSAVQFPQHKLLHKFLTQSLTLAERRQNVVLQH